MTIQIAQRLGSALDIRSATRLRELDQALREYVRSVGTAANVPIGGSIDWSHITSIPATFPPSAHTHPNGDLTGYTAADVLAKLLTVDGSGSGLDADLLDGLSSAAFAGASSTGNWTPADASGAGLVLATVSANYTQHEKTVIARCAFTYPVTASGSNASINGLPFNTSNNQGACQAFISYHNVGSQIFALPDANSATVRFYNSAGANIINSALSGKNIYMTVLYTTP